MLAYSNSYFPMWSSDLDFIQWYSPDPRAIFSLDSIKISKSLRQTLRKQYFTFSIDTAFAEVMQQCRARPSSWISSNFIDVFTEFHRQGYAHSVETWYNGELAGGLYGVSIGGAFFGESMFSRMSDASKAAFAILTQHLKENKFALLDSQYLNAHTRSLGAIEVPRDEYLYKLKEAISLPCKFGDSWRDYSVDFI